MSAAIYGTNTIPVSEDMHTKRSLPSLSLIIPGASKDHSDQFPDHMLASETHPSRDPLDSATYAPASANSQMSYALDSYSQSQPASYSNQSYFSTPLSSGLPQSYMYRDIKQSSLSSRGSGNQSVENLPYGAVGPAQSPVQPEQIPASTHDVLQQPQQQQPQPPIQLQSQPQPRTAPGAMYLSATSSYLAATQYPQPPQSHHMGIQQGYVSLMPQLADMATTERCTCKSTANRIPRPRNAFILFRQKYHQLVLDEGSAARTNPEVSRELGRRWKALPPDEKDYWNNLAEEEKVNHAKKYPGYRYTPRRNGKNKNCVACRHKQMRQQQIQAHNYQAVQIQQQEQHQAYLQQQLQQQQQQTYQQTPMSSSQGQGMANTAYAQSYPPQYIVSSGQYPPNGGMMAPGMAVLVAAPGYQYGYTPEYNYQDKNAQQYSRYPQSGMGIAPPAIPPQPSYAHGSDYKYATTSHEQSPAGSNQFIPLQAPQHLQQQQQQQQSPQPTLQSQQQQQPISQPAIGSQQQQQQQQQAQQAQQSQLPSAQTPQRYNLLPTPVHAGNSYPYESSGYQNSSINAPIPSLTASPMAPPQ